MMELLNNSAFMGFVGIIIGSLFSLLGVFYSERVKKETALEKQKLDREKELSEDKKHAYRHFLNLANRVLTVYANEDINGNLYDKDEKSEILKQILPALSEIDLVAPPETRKAFLQLFNALNKDFGEDFNAKTFSDRYDKAVELCKNDLYGSSAK